MEADSQTSFWDKAPRPHFLTIMKERLATILPAQLGEYLHLPADGFAKLPPASPPPAKLPAGCCLTIADADAPLIADFLRSFYKTGGTQSAAPISSLTAEQIRAAVLAETRFILLRAPAGTLLGTISSQPIGHLRRGSIVSPFPVRYVTNFCVHPQQRRQGAASKLLQAMWADGRSIQEDAMIFLKEGAPLLKAGPAIYSSRWIYRRVADGEAAVAVAAGRVTEVAGTAAVATTVADADASIIVSVPNRPISSRVYIYKGTRGIILAAFSDAHQIHSVDGAPIYYMTGWVEKGQLLQTERLAAARQLSAIAAAKRSVSNSWVWIDEAAIRGVQAPWKQDGPFHYYAFNWTAPQLYGFARLFLLL